MPQNGRKREKQAINDLFHFNWQPSMENEKIAPVLQPKNHPQPNKIQTPQLSIRGRPEILYYIYPGIFVLCIEKGKEWKGGQTMELVNTTRSWRFRCWSAAPCPTTNSARNTRPHAPAKATTWRGAKRCVQGADMT
eukprot:g13201.t1